MIKRFALMARKKRLTPTTPNSRQSQIASFSKRQNKNSSPFLQLAPQKVKCRGGGSALSHSYPAITGASSPINSSDGRDSTNKSIHRASLSSDSPGSLDSSSSSTPIVTNNEATQDGNTTAPRPHVMHQGLAPLIILAVVMLEKLLPMMTPFERR